MTTRDQVTVKSPAPCSLRIPRGPCVMGHHLPLDTRATVLRHRTETMKFTVYFFLGECEWKQYISIFFLCSQKIALLTNKGMNSPLGALWIGELPSAAAWHSLNIGLYMTSFNLMIGNCVLGRDNSLKTLVRKDRKMGRPYWLGKSGVFQSTKTWVSES